MAASYSVATGLTAAGTNAATSLALSPTKTVHQLSTVASGTGVQLPIVPTGTIIVVINQGANLCAVYPQTYGVINSQTAGAAYSQLVGSTVSFFSINGLDWNTSPSSTTASTFPTAPVVSVTATTTLTAAQSGSVINVASSAAAVTINLPAAAAGINFKFYVTGALTNIVTITAAGAIVKGNIYANNATAVVGPSGTASTNILLGTGSVIGDFVTFICVDGTNWICNGGITTNTTLTRS